MSRLIIMTYVYRGFHEQTYYNGLILNSSCVNLQDDSVTCNYAND